MENGDTDGLATIKRFTFTVIPLAWVGNLYYNNTTNAAVRGFLKG